MIIHHQLSDALPLFTVIPAFQYSVIYLLVSNCKNIYGKLPLNGQFQKNYNNNIFRCTPKSSRFARMLKKGHGADLGKKTISIEAKKRKYKNCDKITQEKLLLFVVSTHVPIVIYWIFRMFVITKVNIFQMMNCLKAKHWMTEGLNTKKGCRRNCPIKKIKERIERAFTSAFNV